MSPDREALLGHQMKTLEYLRGHRSRLPANEFAVANMPRLLKHDRILKFFKKNPDPIYTSELSKRLNIGADPLRRLCRTLVVRGSLNSKRTNIGVMYYTP